MVRPGTTTYAWRDGCNCEEVVILTTSKPAVSIRNSEVIEGIPSTVGSRKLSEATESFNFPSTRTVNDCRSRRPGATSSARLADGNRIETINRYSSLDSDVVVTAMLMKDLNVQIRATGRFCAYSRVGMIAGLSLNPA